MKVLFGAIATESNSFSSIPTSLRAFEAYGIRDGEDVYKEPGFFRELALMMRSRIQAAGASAHASIFAFAQPGAPVIQSAYEHLRDKLLRDVSAVSPDMVILSLHGAMLSQGCLDCEGEILARVRAQVGQSVPIGVVLDPHAHLTGRMLDSATILSFMKEYPHTDLLDRVRDVWRICLEIAQGRAPNPAWAVRDCRMIGFWPTQDQPMRGFVDRMIAQEGRDGILSISFVHGFPYGDTPNTGAKVLVYADFNPKAEQCARALQREIWDMRNETRIKTLSIDEAVARLASEAEGLMVLADMADNPGGGAPADSTFVLRAALHRGIRGVAFGLIYDPQAVQLCIDAGVGATLGLRMGGKLGPTSGAPLDLEVQVMAIDSAAQQSGSPGEDPTVLGAAAWVQTGGIDIVLISRREQCYHPDAFSRMGIDLSGHRAVVVKSTNHFQAQFAPIAREILYIDAPGALPPDMSKIPFRTFTRPYWPRVENPWESNGFESEDDAIKVG